MSAHFASVHVTPANRRENSAFQSEPATDPPEYPVDAPQDGDLSSAQQGEHQRALGFEAIAARWKHNAEAYERGLRDLADAVHSVTHGFGLFGLRAVWDISALFGLIVLGLIIMGYKISAQNEKAAATQTSSVPSQQPSPSNAPVPAPSPTPSSMPALPPRPTPPPPPAGPARAS